MAKSPPGNGQENASPQRTTEDSGHQSPVTPQEETDYERWVKDWEERREHPDDWERRRTDELRKAGLVRKDQEAKSRAAWAALFYRPAWERDSFSLDEIAKNVRVPGQVGFNDAASDRILVELFTSVLQHEFDGSVLTWSINPPHLIPFDPEDTRWIQKFGHDNDAAALRTFPVSESLFLTRAACARWCDRNGMLLPPHWSSKYAAIPDEPHEQPARGHDSAIQPNEEIKLSKDVAITGGPTEQPAYDHDGAVPSNKAIKPTPGPKKGSGRYVAADRKLFPEIKKLRGDGYSLHGAVSAILDRISGHGTAVSRISRVRRRYKEENRENQ